MDSDDILINGASSTHRSPSESHHDRRSGKTKSANPLDGSTAAAIRGHHHSEKSKRADRTSQILFQAQASNHLGGGQGKDKDSFMNYFFGNQPGESGGGPSSLLASGISAGSGAVGRGVGGGASDTFPDSSGRADARVSGTRSFDGPGSAFDMRSLGKHLEPVSVVFLSDSKEHTR